MGIKERKEREKDERKKLIHDAAVQIITEEGIENLSIRKIAGKIEYSPAIIYHYFQSKDVIIEHVMKDKYVSLIQVMKALTSIEEPELLLAEFGRKYIGWALDNSELYKTMLLSNSPNILENSSVLFNGAAGKRPALAIVAATIKRICRQDDEKAELTAQIMWASIYGLTIRMIIENTPEEQRQRLIEHHAVFVINAVKALEK